MSSESPQAAESSVVSETIRNRNFQKFLAGQIIAASGDRINQIAILSIIVYKLGSTAKYTADIMFWQILPAVVLGPFAVALIDRWNRRRTMIASDLVRALLVASLPSLMAAWHHHYVIYAVVFLVGTFSALFAPCRLAIMPNLVPGRILMSANSITSQAGTIATLVAAPAGSWLVENFSRTFAFLINGGTYLVSAFFIWTLRPEGPSRPTEGHPSQPVDDFREGFRYIGRRAPILFYVIFTGAAQCVAAVFLVNFFEYSVQVQGQTVGGATLLFVTMGIGMAAGALFLVCFHSLGERTLWPMWMLVNSGVGMMVLSHIWTPWLSAIVLLVIGFHAVMVLVPVDVYLQKHVPDQFRGRVFVVRGVLVGIVFLLSLQFSKALINRWGALATFNNLGIASVILGLVSAAVAWRMVRGRGVDPA